MALGTFHAVGSAFDRTAEIRREMHERPKIFMNYMKTKMRVSKVFKGISRGKRSEGLSAWTLSEGPRRQVLWRKRGVGLRLRGLRPYIMVFLYFEAFLFRPKGRNGREMEGDLGTTKGVGILEGILEGFRGLMGEIEGNEGL